MGHNLKNSALYLLFGMNVFLTIYGFFAVESSPYSGLRLYMCGNQACIKGVDKGSPAEAAGIIEGDVLLDVEGMGIPYFAFSPDPDYVSSRADYRLFWDSLGRLDEAVKAGGPVELSIKRGDTGMDFTVKPTRFPLLRALSRTLPVYLVGWTFMLVGLLVLRKKPNETSAANFIIGTGVCMSLVSLASFTVRDIAYPYLTFKILKETNYLGALPASFAFLHLILVFPRRRPVIDKYPWLIKALYGVLALVFLLHYAEVFENIHLTIYLPVSICLLGFAAWLACDFFREKNSVLKKQIRWVVFGFVSGISAWLALTSVPVMFGAPILSEELSLLPSVLIPLSFAFAITKYRLMDIDDLFDYTVIYGLTILILEGMEIAFLGVVAPYFGSSGTNTPFISVGAVLLIVFAYVPVRNVMKRTVERLFKRGDYNVETEIQNFVVGLGLCDGTSSMEKLANFVKGLMGPSGVCVINSGTNEVVYADSEGARLKGAAISKTEGLKEYFLEKRTSCFAYELLDEVPDSSKSEVIDPPALFVPFFAENDVYVAVFFEKWNRTAYSKKDRTLLNALAVDMGHILEAEQLRMEKALMEEEFRRQKDYVVKEMHDGLGNILTNITVASQVAESVFDRDREKARAMVSSISERSQEAMEFMRAGISVLDNPEGDMGAVISGIRHRFGGLLEAYGLDVDFSVGDNVEAIRAGAKVNLNLIRTIQEAMSNILKHSGARKIEIVFARQGDALTIRIRDDGKGFNIGNVNRGFGIDNMRKRMKDIGGSFDLTSKAEGTTLTFAIPLKSPAGGMEQG